MAQVLFPDLVLLLSIHAVSRHYQTSSTNNINWFSFTLKRCEPHPLQDRLFSLSSSPSPICSSSWKHVGISSGLNSVDDSFYFNVPYHFWRKSDLESGTVASASSHWVIVTQAAELLIGHLNSMILAGVFQVQPIYNLLYQTSKYFSELDIILDQSLPT